VRIDSVTFLRRGTAKEHFVSEISFNHNEPEEHLLLQNYPNPFNPQTAIGFSLLAVGNVTLKVYNVLGQEVAVLIDNERMENGEHEVQFDASGLTSGVYFYRIDVAQNGILSYTATRKLLLIK
jgi:hypothetical protein